MENRLSEKWIKASITGTIWASSEIVLGSFFHNLRVPFSGNILTAIGIIILISISHIWKEKGLLWRAGLICALLKTMSPSAVIFGPMIGIFSEALLLEISLLLLGRNLAGYLIGAMLAMSWNLFQKIVNYLIYYGANIIEVYNNLLQLAQKQLNISTDITWMPIIALLVIFALSGLFAGIIGIIIGRKLLKPPDPDYPCQNLKPGGQIPVKAENRFNYSIAWLLTDVLLIIGSFILLNYTPWIVWGPFITVILFTWTLRYKQALRQLSKPKFWIFFVILTLLTALAFTKAQADEYSWQQGLLTGIQMNVRAAIIMVGFSVLGTELYNPVVKSYFQMTSLRNLPLALELSAESLPSFIGNIPDIKTLIKNPVSIFYQVISQAETRLSEIRKKPFSNQPVFIITGPAGQGKTTFTKNLTIFLSKNNIHPGGIISERILEYSITTGYDLINIETDEKEAFLRQDEKCGPHKIGRFTICPEGLAMGIRILKSMISHGKRLVIIDEVGLLELGNHGWADCINELIQKSNNYLVLVVRDKYKDEVLNKWNISEAVTFNIRDTDHMHAGLCIMKYIQQ
jgi:nucleoside-triphosphatase THEP1